MTKLAVYNLLKSDLEYWLKTYGEKSFRIRQIYDWLYKKRICSFSEMLNIAISLREQLDEQFFISPLTCINRQTATDGTRKFLFSLADGSAIETVLMSNKYGYSLCVSTQVGCKMGCTFCASSLAGLKRHLTTAEMVAQVIYVQRMLDNESERIRSIVLMGMGEPFDNYDNVMNFIRIVNDEDGLAIGARHITVSTCGVVPNIYRFAHENWQVNFAVSLHATTDDKRSKLMPINRKYPLKELLAAVRYYTKVTGRRVSFEFGLIHNENDSKKEALQLGELIKDIKCHVNLIPINYVSERHKQGSPKDRVNLFEKTLKSQGINTTVRRTQGEKIAAACGQLRLQHSNL